jgi:hypothetical protein
MSQKQNQPLTQPRQKKSTIQLTGTTIVSTILPFIPIIAATIISTILPFIPIIALETRAPINISGTISLQLSILSLRLHHKSNPSSSTINNIPSTTPCQIHQAINQNLRQMHSHLRQHNIKSLHIRTTIFNLWNHQHNHRRLQPRLPKQETKMRVLSPS